MFLYQLFSGAGLALLVYLLVKKIQLKWYEWVLGLLGYVLLLFAVQNYAASIIEVEARAGGILLMLFGIPALILLGITYFLANKRLKA